MNVFECQGVKMAESPKALGSGQLLLREGATRNTTLHMGQADLGGQG